MSTDSTGGTERPGDADSSDDGAVDGLVSRLRVIEDQPLESRAAAFSQLHDQLQRALEGGDSSQRHA